jgi:hypothetical protein
MLTLFVETMGDLSLDEWMTLGHANADIFGHSFGAQLVADDVPIDVVQKVLGQALAAGDLNLCSGGKETDLGRGGRLLCATPE